MYIREYGNGQYRVEVNKYGKSASQAGFDTRADALRWGQEKEAEFEALKGGKGATFSAARVRYLERVSSKKKGEAQEREGRRLAEMEAFFGATTPLAKITKAQIADWRDHRLETVKGATVDREANLLRNLFRVARVEWEWIHHNPFEGVKMPNEKDSRELTWGWRDIRRILRHCQNSDGPKTQQLGAAFHIALRTAMRLQEVLAARKEGVLAVIEDSKTTKKGKRITIPLTRQGRKIMDRYKDVVFTVGPNEASTLFHKACLQCGIREEGVDGVTFHDTRATALTHMAKKMPVQHLQRISRHKNINILINTYYRETNQQIAEGL